MQKLVVLNEKDYQKLTARNEDDVTLTTLPGQHATIAPLVQERQRLKQDMEKIETNNIPSDVKYDQLQQDLRRYMLMHEKMQQPLPIPVVTHSPPPPPKPTTNTKLPLQLTGMTKRQQQLADILVDHLHNNEDVDWNARNEVIIEGQLVPNSNMVDLIHDLVRQRKNMAPPIGFDELAHALRKHNAPREAISNLERRQAIFSPPIDYNYDDEEDLKYQMASSSPPPQFGFGFRYKGLY